jgi:hypothetical protein
LSDKDGIARVEGSTIMSPLPRDVRELIDSHGGVIDTASAKQAGLSDGRLRKLASNGHLTRIIAGCYALPDVAEGLTAWERFELRARAFAMSVPDSYLTGWGATIAWKLPTLGKPPNVPTVVRPKSAGHGSSISKRGRIVEATLAAEHRFRMGRAGVVSKAWAAVDVARTARLPHSLVVADEAVRQGVDLAAVLPHICRWEGVGRAKWVIENADPAIESPLETLGRFAFMEHDLPMPVINAWVGRDSPERRVDGLLPWHWWAIEGDGALKYNNRADAARIVKDQNDREFGLRRLGLDFVRYTWADVYPDRSPLTTKARAMFGDHPPRDTPVRWWKNVPGKGPVEPTAADWPSASPAGIVLPAGAAIGNVLGHTRPL